MKPTHILLTLCLLCLLLLPAAAAADTVSYNGKTYTTYDQIYDSKTLSSSEKLSLVQEMAGWTEELAAYMEWKNSGGLEAYQAAVSGGNTTNSTGTSSDYGWNEAPGDGLGDSGTNIEPEYSYQERQAYDAAYNDYMQAMTANYDYAAVTNSGGSGTQADPYLISSAADLDALVQTSTYTYYLQTADIVLPNWNPSFDTDVFATIYGDYNGGGFIIDGSNFAKSSNHNYNNGVFAGAAGSSFRQINFINFDYYTRNAGLICGINVNALNVEVSDIIVSSCTIDGHVSPGILKVQHASNIVVLNSELKQEGGGSSDYAYRRVGITSTSSSDESFSLTFENSIVIDSNVLYSTSNYRYSGYRVGYGTITNCYAANTLVNSITPSSNIGANAYNGATITATEYNSESWWKTTMSAWDWENIWQWNSETNLPELRNANNQAVPPTISAVSVSPSVGGQETTYTLSTSATTTGQGGISGYQWYTKIGSSGSWQAINGATSATYTFVPGSYAVGDFWFKVVVAGADGGVTDSYDAGFTNVKTTIVLAPQITSPAATPAEGPLSQTVTLSASVTSTETVTYQWEEQISGTWTAISGATSATSTVTVSDNAATTHSYRLIASNIGGSSTSSTVTYSSVAVPTINSVSASPSSGPLSQSVTLSATVSGATSLQWQEQIGGTWTAISGATSATSTVSVSDSAATTHSYRLVASNVGGSSTSSTVTYTSVAVPTISSVSASPSSGPLSQSVTLSATVSGATSLQWQEQIGGTWTAISGATSATSTVSVSDSAATTHSYRLVASNIGGSSTSSTVTYTSVAVPTISAVSASPTSGPLSQSVTLSATVSGATSLQWEEQISGTWTAISGATSATSTVSVSDSAATTHSYRLVASNIGGSSTSSTVTYLSVVPPTISAVSTTPASGPLSETIQLSATVTGATSYQWQELIGGNWQNIQGATSATHTQTINDQQPTLHTYRLIASNIGGTTTSDETTYQSSSGPLITAVSASPSSGPLTQTVTLSVSATSQYTISYQWQERISGNWQDISGATSATTTISISDSVQTVHTYRVLATDVGGTTPSATVTYSSIAPPVIQGANINPVVGKYTETITLSAEVSGADTYQWQQQSGSTWVNISGATTNPWVGTVTVSGDTNYRLIASNIGGSTYSDTIQYTIAGPANIQSLTATPSVITLPGSTTLTATGSNVISWEWQQYTSGVWTPIGYSASVTERFTDAGTYQFRVLATGADGVIVTSETVEVIAGFAPSVSITSPNDGTRYQSGERIPLTATITGTDPTWEWSFGSQNVQTGGNSQTTWVEYGIDGRYTISIRVVSLFGTDEDSITIISGRESRPIAKTPPLELESDGIFKATDSLTPNENGMPDITGFIMSMSKPFTDMIGAWFYFVLFAVPYLIIWIRQKNIIIPSILGVLFAAWVLIQLPAAALPAAIALITLSVTGGLYGIYVKLQNR